MKELISIIIPVYNVEDYLPDCLESVINQSYSNLEIILINDGSKDGSGRICEQYRNTDSRIVLINQENKGVSAARNKGLEVAKGIYVTFIDSDDYVENNYIEELYSNITEETDMVCCNIPGNSRREIIKDKWEIAHIFSLSGYTWGKLIKKECIAELFSEKVCYAEDYIFYLSMLPKLNNVKILNYDGYYYRVRPGSLSVKDKDEEHTLKEFDNKYTFVLADDLIENVLEESDNKTKWEIKSHCYYIYTLLLLLMYRVRSKDKVKRKHIRRLMRKCRKGFYKVTLLKEKNVKRYMFGLIVYLFPVGGSRIAHKLLKNM